MTFKIQKDPKFWTDVTVVTPTDDGPREDTFRARFRQQPADKVNAATDQGDASLRDFLEETVVDFQDVLDDEDQSVPFSAELLSNMLDNVGVLSGLWSAYINAIVAARTGN